MESWEKLLCLYCTYVSVGYCVFFLVCVSGMRSACCCYCDCILLSIASLSVWCLYWVNLSEKAGTNRIGHIVGWAIHSLYRKQMSIISGTLYDLAIILFTSKSHSGGGRDCRLHTIDAHTVWCCWLCTMLPIYQTLKLFPCSIHRIGWVTWVVREWATEHDVWVKM